MAMSGSEREEIEREIRILEKKVGIKFPEEPINDEWIMNKLKLDILRKYLKEYKED